MVGTDGGVRAGVGRPRWPHCRRRTGSTPWLRRGLVFKTVVCNPSVSRAAYQEAAQLLPDDAPAALRAQVLLGLAWNEASLGDPECCRTLLAEVAALVPAPTTTPSPRSRPLA